MAADYAEYGIRVNALCPGSVDTPLLRRACERVRSGSAEAMLETYASYTLLKRAATTEEIASVALFFASDESSYITGAALPVDGGMSIQ
jgi:NAD(P)-dependent dehydrogenase (short-subunit alcohol dehydrogenase family)